MRKIVAMILTTVMLLCPMAAFSEEKVIDFSTYTIDELVKIWTQLESEIAGRIEYQNPDMIYRGKYVVGKDIEPGQYVFICVEALMGSSAPEGSVHLWQTIDENGQGKTCVFYAYDLAPGDSVTVTLEPGMLWEIEDCSGTFRVCDQSWAMVVAKEPDSDSSEVSSDEPVVNDSALRPEFKAAMNAYEEFYERYVTLMAMDNLGFEQMAEYLELSEQLIEIEESFSSWDGNMNDAELKYYIEVHKRVLEKLSALD